MRRSILHALIPIVVVLAAFGYIPAVQTQSVLVDGQVIKIDESARKITIRHAPFKKFDMDEPMTMVYAVQDPAMLKLVKAGEKVKFDAERINGQFTVTKLERAR